MATLQRFVSSVTDKSSCTVYISNVIQFLAGCTGCTVNVNNILAVLGDRRSIGMNAGSTRKMSSVWPQPWSPAKTMSLEVWPTGDYNTQPLKMAADWRCQS